jgi:cytochrome c-type biogenesis protein CcmH/NrfG
MESSRNRAELGNLHVVYMMRTKCLSPIFRLSIIAIFYSSIVIAQDASNPKQKIDELQQQAQSDLLQQKPQLAIPLLRQIVSLDPQNVNARGNLGVLLFFQNDYPEAITEMRAALQLQSGLWKIQALLGIAEKRTGELAPAESDLEQSFPNLDDTGIQKEAGLELIEIASASGELDEAASVIARLEKAAPQDPQVLFAAYQVFVQMVDRTLLNMTMTAPNSAELHMMMADQFVLQGDSDNAIAQFREAIRMNPKLPGVHFELAAQLKDSSNPALKAQAEHEFMTALSLNQFDEKAWRGLGEIMADKGDVPAAKKDFAKALSLNPKDSDVETDMAKLLIAQNDTKTAGSLLESAVNDDPTNIVAHYQLGALYRQEGRSAEAQHQMEEFARYKALKDQLAKVFRQFRQQDDSTGASSQPAPH